jgi:hypothetical protein
MPQKSCPHGCYANATMCGRRGKDGLSIQIDEFFEYLKSIKLAVAQTAAPIRPKKVTKLFNTHPTHS